MPYSEYRFYSVLKDADYVRLSMSNERGGEYWREIPAADGRRWRERRDEALDLIEQAIAAKLEPGEVVPA